MGYIYILTNPSFPEYVKIGYADDVKTRLTQLNRSEFRYIFVYYNRVRITTTNPFGLPPVAYREWAKANKPPAA